MDMNPGFDPIFKRSGWCARHETRTGTHGRADFVTQFKGGFVSEGRVAFKVDINKKFKKISFLFHDI
jgi:hypothetical protein